MTDKRKFITKRRVLRRKADRSRRTESSLSDSDLTIEQGLTLFIRAKEAEQVRSSTIRNYMNHIEYLTDYLTEVKAYNQPKLKDLTAELIRDYIHYLLYERLRYKGIEGRQDKTMGLSPNTVNIRLRTLRTMSRYWANEGYIEANFMEQVNPIRIDEPEDRQGLSDAEIDLLLHSYDETSYADYRDLILIYLLLDTGLRINEAVGLTSERIDYDRLVLYVPSRVAKNRRNREVPISVEVSKKLLELHSETSGYFGDSERIFFNAYGEPFTADAFRKRLNRRKNRLGLERLSPHMFRHTFGRNFLLNGGDIATLKRILDHADIETTRKYAVMDNEDIKMQHNRYSPLKDVLKRKRGL